MKQEFIDFLNALMEAAPDVVKEKMNDNVKAYIDALIDKIVIDKDRNITIKFKYDVIPQIDFIYVEDVVEAYWQILRHQDKDLFYHRYEIGTGEVTSIKELAIMAKKLLHSKTRLAFGALPYRENEIMESKANIESLNRLGWIPKFSI